MKYEMILIAVAAIVLLVVLAKMPKVHHAFLVPEGYAGLLYQHGKFVKQLASGRHVVWGRNFTISLQDLRKGFLAVSGQEVLTADNIAVKLSLLISYQVSDPVKAAHDTQHWNGDIYHVAQLALRNVISGVAAEALLSQRMDLAPQLLEQVQPEAAKIGITIHAVKVKDVMLPGELKRAFGETLKAKQEGQAALERARGETAALRNLANAARVLEGNPALMNLRLVQSLTAAQGAGHTLVFGMPAGFVPLKNGSTSQADASANET